MKQELLFSPVLFGVVPEVANATGQEKEIKGIKRGEEKVNMSLSPADMFM